MKNKRKNVQTSIKNIVEYWEYRISECGLNVDWAEANERCWKCGYKRNLQKCHIIPDSLGGEDTPANLVLLCDQCHKEAPNVQDSKFMWDWLKSFHAPFYDTYWNLRAIDEYKNIYNKDFIKELKSRNIVTNHAFREFWNIKIGESSYHFGNPYGNLSTLVGKLKMRIDAFDQKHKNKKYKSDILIEKEKNFESFVYKVCSLCFENNWTVWEGSTKNPYAICISADYENSLKTISIAIRINRKNTYIMCYCDDINPNNIPLDRYTINLGNDPTQVISRLEKEILNFNKKYGNPSPNTAYFVSDPIWSNKK